MRLALHAARGTALPYRTGSGSSGISFTERLVASGCASCSAAEGHAANRIQIQIRRGNLGASGRRAAQYRPAPPEGIAGDRRAHQPPTGEGHDVPHSNYLPERMGTAEISPRGEF